MAPSGDITIMWKLPRPAVVWILLAFCPLACTMGPPDGGAVRTRLDRPSPSTEVPTLDVFVLPFSHCDTAWRRSFDEYYAEKVEGILSNITGSLRTDSHRFFNWADIAFFRRWYEAHSEASQATVRELVQSGRLEFIGGGWVSHDEVLVEFGSALKQFTLGQEWLKDTFGVTVRFAWQIDAFGQSRATPSLLASLGYGGCVVSRMDNEFKKELGLTSGLQFLWEGLPNHINDERRHREAVFTHVLHGSSGGYCSPPNFDFEGPEEDNPLPRPGNIADRAEALHRYIRGLHVLYRTPHVLLPVGCDFQWGKSERVFTAWEQLMAHVNKNVTAFHLNIRFATLSQFFEAVRQFQATSAHNGTAWNWRHYSNDLLPYRQSTQWEGRRRFWSGFFGARRALKVPSLCGVRSLEVQRLVRVHEILLRYAEVGRSLHTVASPHIQQFAAWLAWGRELSALAVHHDVIAGTVKSEVAKGMRLQLVASIANLSTIVEETTFSQMQASSPRLEQAQTFAGKLGRLLPHFRKPTKPNKETQKQKDQFRLHTLLTERGAPGRLLSDAVLPVVLLNGLAWARKEVVAVPVRHSQVRVFNSAGSEIASQVVSATLPCGYGLERLTLPKNATNSSSKVSSLPQEVPSNFHLYFAAETPPLGANTYFLSLESPAPSNASAAMPYEPKPVAEQSEASLLEVNEKEEKEDVIVLENAVYRLTADRKTGRLQSIVNVLSEQHFDVELVFRKTESDVNEGAYIFEPKSNPRPLDHFAEAPEDKETAQQEAKQRAHEERHVVVSVHKGAVVQVLRQSFPLSQFVKTREVRLYSCLLDREAGSRAQRPLPGRFRYRHQCGLIEVVEEIGPLPKDNVAVFSSYRVTLRSPQQQGKRWRGPHVEFYQPKHKWPRFRQVPSMESMRWEPKEGGWTTPRPADAAAIRAALLHTSVGLDSSAWLYTDASDLFLVPRPPPPHVDDVTTQFAGSLFPIVSSAVVLINHEARTHSDFGAQLTLFVDAATAVHSDRPGSLDILQHRRTVTDDSRGLNEPLDDPEPVVARHCIALGPLDPRFRGDGPGVLRWLDVLNEPLQETANASSAANATKPRIQAETQDTRTRFGHSLLMNQPPLAMFGVQAGGIGVPTDLQAWAAAVHPGLEPLGQAFPAHLHMLGLRPAGEEGELLLRVTNTAEFPTPQDISPAVVNNATNTTTSTALPFDSVDLLSTFSALRVSKVHEVALSGVETPADVQASRVKWNWSPALNSTAPPPSNVVEVKTNFHVELKPLEMRAFLLHLDPQAADVADANTGGIKKVKLRFFPT